MTTPAPYGAPQPAQRRKRHSLYVALAAGGLLTATLAYIGLVDPHNPDAIFPVCPFRLLTGLNCPGCGALRMIHDMLHGELAAAITDNVVLLVGLPLLAGWALIRVRRGKSPLTIPTTAAVVATLLAWTVVRNLPGFPLVPTLLTH